MSIDVLNHDLFPRDEHYPATLLALTFESHGEQFLRTRVVAQGAGPHPTIVLLQGFPGNEQNGDLAHIFRRAGWNVLSVPLSRSVGQSRHVFVYPLLRRCGKCALLAQNS